MNNLTILIINFNNSKDTLNLLDSLKNSNFKNFDILIWDNNSNLKDGFNDLENCKGIKLVKHNKNIGLTGGVNEALKLIKTKYILLINPDTVIDKNTIKEMLSTIEDDEKIAFVSAAIYNYKDKNKVDSFGGRINFFTGIGRPLKNETNVRELKYGEYCDACCLMFNREIFEKLGSYDDRYFAYAETEDVLFKAMKQGYKVFINPKAKIWHKLYGSSGEKRSKFTTYHLARNRILFMKKNVNNLRFILFLFLNLFIILPLQTFLLIRRGNFDLICNYYMGIYHGLIGKYGTAFFD